MEHCSTTVFPGFDYSLPVNIVGVYRPPESKHPPYEQALETMLKDHKTKRTTAIAVRVLYVTSWKKEYSEWVEKEETWE